MRALSLRVRAHSLEHRKHDLPRGFPLSDPFSRNKPDGERARNDVLLFRGSKLQHYTHGFLSYQGDLSAEAERLLLAYPVITHTPNM